jgi:Pectate lyase superfamily protein
VKKLLLAAVLLLLCASAQATINVRSFGAVPNDNTDDSAAFLKAIAAAANSTPRREIYIPEGRFDLDQTNVLGRVPFPSVGGGTLRFRGAGAYLTDLNLRTNGTEKWFLRNGAGNKAYQHPIFEDIRFTSDDRTKGNGFEVWSEGYDKAYTFRYCIFEALGTVFRTEGKYNADVNKFIACKFRSITNAVLYLNNSQSISHDFVTCDAELIYGSVVEVGTAGGGAVSWWGGSVILSQAAADHYILKLADADVIGPQNANFNFYNLKVELNADTAKIADLGTKTNLGQAHVLFEGCNFNTVSNSDKPSRVLVRIADGHHVTFRNCVMPSETSTSVVQYQMSPSSSAEAHLAPVMEFVSCLVPSQFPEHMVNSTGFAGVFRARGCYSDRGRMQGKPRVALDFDIGGFNSGLHGPSTELKTVVLKATTEPWPSAEHADGDYRVRLPPNAIIVNVFVFKPAGGGEELYRLAIGNDNKTVVHGRSELAPQRAEHRITVSNLLFAVGMSPNERVLRLWAETNARGVATLGYAIVQYF